MTQKTEIQIQAERTATFIQDERDARVMLAHLKGKLDALRRHSPSTVSPEAAEEASRLRAAVTKAATMIGK